MAGRTDIHEILSAQAEMEPCPHCGCKEKDKYESCTCCGQIVDTDFD